ncbi:hypothetical protein [Schaalia sp. Marseille-Q2122]|uniref:hypothetical protein n=1 Tax=Schaalia sp. Marseille-Q2122 TaxID=2736604 RepID=UPI00158BAE07|nr:hypothetical protein [Schaalia sp. Marseille-Q2122]
MLETMQMDDVSVDLSFSEFDALSGWCVRGVKPGFLVSRRLKSAGVWDAGELTDLGRELVAGLVDGHTYFNTMKYSASGMEQLMIWAGGGMMTCARRHSRSVRVWSAQSCELPAILAHFLGFVPRVTYSCGPYALPAEVGQLIVQGNVAGLRLLLGNVGLEYEASPPQGEVPVTPLSYGLSRELWELSLVQVFPFGVGRTEAQKDDVDRSLVYLMVPESMYAVQGQHDEAGNLVGYNVSSTRPLMEWGRLIDICGGVL